MVYDRLQACRRRFSPAGLLWKLFRFFLLLGLSYIFLFPVLYMLSVAIRPPSSVNDPSIVWVPRELSLESIKATMKAMDYTRALMQTLTVSLGGTIASLLSGSFVGYGLARFRFREKNLAFLLLILTIIVPPQTIVLSSYINFRYFDFFGLLKLLSVIPGIPDSINLLNTPWTFILPSLFAAGLRSGLFVYIFRQFYLGMPKDLEEAARIDGCGIFKTYLRIMLPLTKPAIITVLLFSFIWHWNDYYLSSMYFMSEMPLSVVLGQIKTMLAENQIAGSTTEMLRTYIQAASLLTVTPPLILYLLTQKFFTESIERTGIVG